MLHQLTESNSSSISASEALAPTPKKNPIFPQLTGIRAVAALMVFIFHLNPFQSGTLSERITREFHTGVAIFFVLSGFLITLRYHDKVALNGRWFFTYMKNRFARVYPIFFLLTLVTYLPLFFINGNKNLFFELLINLFLLKAFFNSFALSGLMQAWSLTVEECFYILAPFVFLLHKQHRKLTYLLPLGSLSIGFLLVAISAGKAPFGFFVDYMFMLKFTFFGRCTEFFVGIALAYTFLKRPASTPPTRYATAGGILLIICCLAALMLLQQGGMQGFDTYAGRFVNNALLPLAIAYFFWGLLLERTWLTKILSTRTAVLLGKSSYAFYLLQVGPIADWIHHLIPQLFGQIIFMVLLSIFVYYAIEEPVNKYIRHL